MSTTHPFVGAQSPESWLPAAMRPRASAQDGLAVSARRIHRPHRAVGRREAAPIDVSLVWGERPADRQTVTVKVVGPDVPHVPLSFTAGATTERGRWKSSARGKGAFRVGTVSLMPADNVEGIRADTLQLLRELNAPGLPLAGRQLRQRLRLARRHRRPRPAAAAQEPRLDGRRAQRLRHPRVHGALPADRHRAVHRREQRPGRRASRRPTRSNTPTARPRRRWGGCGRRTGTPSRYGCKLVAIGNEMYGDWQLGHMPLDEYVQKHNEFAEAMRAKDPASDSMAVGRRGRSGARRCSRAAPTTWT